MGRTKLRNWVPAALLRSPMHALVSDKLILVTFRGRRSGRTYTAPIVYSRHGDVLIVATDSRWWRNFVPEAPTQVRLRGRELPAIGRAVIDRDEAAQLLAALIRQVPSYRRWARVRLEGREPDADDVRTAVARGRVPILLRLQASG